MFYGTPFLCAAALAASFSVLPSESMARSCGGSGQKPCSIFDSGFFEIGNFCENDLDHIPFVACAPKIEDDAFAKKVEELAVLVGEIYIAFNITAGPVGDIVTVLDVAGAKNPEEVQRIIEEDPRFDRVYALARGLGMNTLTVGLAGGGSLIGGGGLESGVSLDVHKQATAYGYFSSYTSIGLQFGLGADLVVSGFLTDNICIEDGTSLGTSVYADVGPGGGIIIWHGEDGAFLGFSVPVGVGGIGAGIASVRAITDVLLAECGVTNAPDPVIVPAPGPVPEPVEPPRYLVLAGDNLWNIAAATYDDALAYPVIYQANAEIITDPDRIYPGQSLVLPLNP